ncbi:hypothetical protein ACFPT7_19665 [Acidicapsa dinghuensis]|uniref:Uncharacterized protein n=1 Tax=Acidicapsa dinghuensis TaxID=2218256 RepID=A0ABW1EMK8_9BACT|nr:hypothetical protein [Acidicapsa dinghuensis]
MSELYSSKLSTCGVWGGAGWSETIICAVWDASCKMIAEGRFTVRGKLDIGDGGVVDANKLASIKQTNAVEVISKPARQTSPPVETRRTTRNGIPLLHVKPGSFRVTPELVHEQREELSEASNG